MAQPILADFGALYSLFGRELDLPGHSVGLQRGAPSLYVNCSSPHKLPNPTSDAFFDMIDTILAELSQLFPDGFVHMGGDEVDTDCWTENGEVMAWAAKRNMTAIGLLGYFQSRIQAIVQNHGKASMFCEQS